MSAKHPVVAVTGSSGAGTTTVKNAFEHIFYRENIKPLVVEGDSFHCFDRAAMKEAMAKAESEGNRYFSHFGPEANHFDKIAETFKSYSETGTCKRRYYIHSDEEAVEHNARLGGTDYTAGQFTPWDDITEETDLLFYEGLHGCAKDGNADVSKYADLKIGVVPIVNLEWIQKIFRDNAQRGYSAEAIVDTILRRMPDYMNYITPQFSRTDINFQRVPTVDTSNPFIARDIPTPDESFVVIRFKDPKKYNVNFQYLQSMIKDSFMSRRNTLVVPGGKMGFAMEIILTPIMEEMMAKRG
ncbi:phosphoribulokinase [Solemya pervernicosa gill symbiont]|uniref:Phosphoribulokinase n=2 Tax=Gammaproteobacteria incertae sedis TaxID=118884 RepID=A0A1T2L358_9GAMM|nr:phosphoribulokinase [Candidatus Reidiella endopervernicosa]OOZ39509.1 phosphoribulokinase [Solemya pervernicosa gill symbiont]QKQ25865.1 phosphoribulokinase [Candidatus Reidiella endopervernicosa]